MSLPAHCLAVLYLLLVLALAASCGAGVAADPRAGLPGAAQLPLPSAEGSWPKAASGSNLLDGVDTYSDSDQVGEDFVHPNLLVPTALTLDSFTDGSPEFVWAIWRVQLSEGMIITGVTITTYSSSKKQFYAGLANYTAGHWEFQEFKDNGSLVLPVNEAVLHSPSNSVCIAIVYTKADANSDPPKPLNVATINVETEGGSSDLPIEDAYEENDPMEQAVLMLPGYYHAAIYETYRPEMGGSDRFDFYKVTLETGQHLTATLKFEPFDHFWFWSETFPAPNYNDLDVLIYPPNSTRPYDDFIESASGMEIYYYAADEGYYQATEDGDYIVGILGDPDGPDNNAEYGLGLYVSDSAHGVSGTVTFEGAEVTEQYLVFLDTDDPGNPGFFNGIARLDTVPHGKYTIRGVPDGAYTLKVQTSGAFWGYGDHPGVWQQTVPVTMAGSELSNVNINISGTPDPPV